MKTATTRQGFSIAIAASILSFSLVCGFADPHPSVAPWPESTLATFGFDGDLGNSLFEPAIIGMESAHTVESWSGYALVRDLASTNGPVAIPVVSGAQTNVAPAFGAIRFWMAPEWNSTDMGGSGPGYEAQLLQLLSLNTATPQTRWALSVSADGTQIQLKGINSNGGNSEVLTVSASWQAGQWQMVTLCYGPTNSELFIDGDLVATGGGLMPPAPWQISSLGVVIGSDLSGGNTAQAQFDELRTFDYWPDVLRESFYYRGMMGLIAPENRSSGLAGRLAMSFSGMTAGSLDPGSTDGSGDGSAPAGASPLLSFADGSFYLVITGVSNGAAGIILTNTLSDVPYDLQSKEALTNTDWIVETNVIGAANQNWTPASVFVGTRTNNLFIYGRSWLDSQGVGIPDWWQMKYFGVVGIDPFADPDGDGWSNLDEFLRGTNPTQPDMPPPPRAVSAVLDSTGTNIIVTWASGGGPVDHYAIIEDSSEQGQVGSSTFTATLPSNFDYTSGDAFGEPVLEIRAYYTGGAHQDSISVTVSRPSLTPDMHVFRGSGGQLYLSVAAPPKNLSFVRLLWAIDEWNGIYQSFDLPATNLVNGIMPIPVQDWQAYAGQHPFQLQAYDTNGAFGSYVGYFGLEVTPEMWGYPVFGFPDARSNMVQNLKFLIRSATVTQPFSYESYFGEDGTIKSYPGTDPAFYYGWQPSSSGFEYYGFRYYSPYLQTAFMDEVRPVKENFLWQNFLFDPNKTDGNGFPNNGAGWDYDGNIKVLDVSAAEFTGTLTNAPAPLAFTNTGNTWLFDRPAYDSDPTTLADLGLAIDGGGTLSIAFGARNGYGLVVDSMKFMSLSSGQFDTLNFGGPGVPYADYQGYHAYFANVDVPIFSTAGYYFTTAGNPIPGWPQFSLTNTSSLLIGAVGKLMTVSGWAKKQILNSYPTKYAYLEQYFDGAFTIATNGVVTTNQAGVISPYGEFFPTTPGPVALRTMPDVETGDRGTGVVNVVKLQFDVNHDGIMDLSFAGPDTATRANPMVFWINNDADVSSDTSDPGHDSDPGKHSDFGKSNIPSQRDLEDWARFWICGMPALPNDGSYQVKLSWNVASGTPAINLVTAVETNGGIGYLTDTNIAALQTTGSSFVSPNYKFASVWPSQPYTFYNDFFTDGKTRYLLFEGASAGSGELVLTISQGTKIIAQASAWLDLHDVKDMYERVKITGVNNTPPISSFLSSGYQQLNQLDSGSGEDTNIIVFVHGWRMGVWDYYNFSESMFKRLYWQGYSGRFISIRWDTLSADDFKFASTLQSFFTYNSSEYRAWESAKGVSDYLTYLKQERFPNYNINICAHSMGNVVMAEALKLQLATGQHNVNNYVLMQAAVPASCYDTSFTNYAPLIEAEQQRGPTPNIYWGYLGTINGAVTGHFVDFYNTNDYALATGTIYIPLYGDKLVSWEANQENYKPDSDFLYSTDGTNSWRAGTLMVETHEIMSFCARPRSKAVGAQPNVGGVVLTSGQVDLKANFGFNDKKDQHSAQFNWNIQQLSGFYHQLGISLGVLQPSTP